MPNPSSRLIHLSKQISPPPVNGNTATTTSSSSGTTDSPLRKQGHCQQPTSIPWNPSNDIFPLLHELPSIPGAPTGAAWFWGADDNLGRINLLTPERVLAAKQEIQVGEVVQLTLPLDEPNPPAFHRRPLEHKIISLGSGAFDDEYSLNTQSSTQWDGFRHIAHPSGVFYNNTPQSSIQSSSATTTATSSTEHIDNHKGGLQSIAAHGIATRAIFLDYHSWSQSNASAAAGHRINPFTRDAISLAQLFACGKAQGLNLLPARSGGDIRPGDILLVRIGFTTKYRSTSKEGWTRLAKREQKDQHWAGLDGGSQELRTWIHDCYFAAVASDAPALEVWPPKDHRVSLHTTLLPLWGVLIGEFFDLESLSTVCAREGRWSVFFSSTMPHVKGGVGAWPGAVAIL